MNVFTVVKQNITTRQAAEMYGIYVNYNGMAVCPFHSDKNPSLKVDNRFHCFGCQADGDAIDFASLLFGLPARAAAIKLADDFGLNYSKKYHTIPVGPKQRILSPEEVFQKDEKRCFLTLVNYLHLLQAWEKQYAPHDIEDPFLPQFVKVLRKKDHINHLIDILIYGSVEEKKGLVDEYKEALEKLNQWLGEKMSDKAVEMEAQAKLDTLNTDLDMLEKLLLNDANDSIIQNLEKWMRATRPRKKF